MEYIVTRAGTEFSESQPLHSDCGHDVTVPIPQPPGQTTELASSVGHYQLIVSAPVSLPISLVSSVLSQSTTEQQSSPVIVKRKRGRPRTRPLPVVTDNRETRNGLESSETFQASVRGGNSEPVATGSSVVGACTPDVKNSYTGKKRGRKPKCRNAAYFKLRRTMQANALKNSASELHLSDEREQVNNSESTSAESNSCPEGHDPGPTVDSEGTTGKEPGTRQTAVGVKSKRGRKRKSEQNDCSAPVPTKKRTYHFRLKRTATWKVTSLSAESQRGGIPQIKIANIVGASQNGGSTTHSGANNGKKRLQNSSGGQSSADEKRRSSSLTKSFCQKSPELGKANGHPTASRVESLLERATKEWSKPVIDECSGGEKKKRDFSSSASSAPSKRKARVGGDTVSHETFDTIVSESSAYSRQSQSNCSTRFEASTMTNLSPSRRMGSSDLVMETSARPSSLRLRTAVGLSKSMLPADVTVTEGESEVTVVVGTNFQIQSRHDVISACKRLVGVSGEDDRNASHVGGALRLHCGATGAESRQTGNAVHSASDTDIHSRQVCHRLFALSITQN